jgi:hypothetical protein
MANVAPSDLLTPVPLLSKRTKNSTKLYLSNLDVRGYRLPHTLQDSATPSLQFSIPPTLWKTSKTA